VTDNQIAVACSQLKEPELTAELDQLCRRHGQDANQVRQKVEFLKKVHEKQTAPPASAPDRRLIRQFEIEKELGAGGGGKVFLARDTRLDRPVALKQVPKEARPEAEFAARVKHPAIVEVYETFEHNGAAYIVLEFCPGGSLKEHLTGAPCVDFQWAAVLLRQVTDAVQHAHQRQVIHRDLKPGNILLTADGQPKVSDFGLARRLDQSDSGQTADGCILGTPSYMAPEQAEGHSRTVDVTADIYALGAILYELLTGRPPFKGATWTDTLEQVRKQEPVLPVRLNPKVPRDVETICLKCLRKDPAKRYPSAAELADDLARFVTGDSIRARRASPRERAWKWAKKNPAWVALGGLVVVAAVVIVVLATVHTQRLQAALAAETAQREHAQENLETAFQAVDSAFLQIGEKHLDSVPGMEILRRDLLQAALPHLTRLLARYESDPRLRDQLAGLHHRIGDMYGITNDPDAALDHFTKALEVRRSLAAEQADDPARASAVAMTLRSIGNLLLPLKDRTAEGLSRLEEALGIHEALVAALPGNAEFQHDLAESLRDLARAYKNDQGRAAVGIAQLARAIAILERLPADVVRYRRALATAYNQRGGMLADFGSKQDALESYHGAIALREELFRGDARNVVLRHELAMSYNDAALLLEQLGQLRQALESFDKSLALREQLADDAPAVIEFQSRLAATHNNMGRLLMDLIGPSAPATKHFEEALKIRQRLVSQSPANLDYKASLGHIQQNLAMIASRLGRKQAAADRLREVTRTRRAIIAGRPQHPGHLRHLAYTLHLLGELHLELGQLEEAGKALTEAEQIRLKLVDREPTALDLRDDLVLSRLAAGYLRLRKGDGPGALVSFDKAVTEVRKLDHPDVCVPEYVRHLAQALSARGDVRAKQGQMPEARADFEAAVAAAQRASDTSPENWWHQDALAQAQQLLAGCLHALGAEEQADEQFRAAADIRHRLSQANPESLDLRSAYGVTLTAWGRAQLDRGLTAKAIPLLEQAQELQGVATRAAPGVPVYRERLADIHKLLEQARSGRAGVRPPIYVPPVSAPGSSRNMHRLRGAEGSDSR
jgi:serine/threonine-protein kinase